MHLSSFHELTSPTSSIPTRLFCVVNTTIPRSGLPRGSYSNAPIASFDSVDKFSSRSSVSTLSKRAMLLARALQALGGALQWIPRFLVWCPISSILSEQSIIHTFGIISPPYSFWSMHETLLMITTDILFRYTTWEQWILSCKTDPWKFILMFSCSYCTLEKVLEIISIIIDK